MSKPQATATSVQTDEQSGNTSADALSKMDELVKRRDEINERIAEIKNEYGVINTKRGQLQTAIRDLQYRLSGIPENDKRYDGTRQELTVELEQLRIGFAQNEERQKKLDEEGKQLATIELPACMVAVFAEDVMEHQRRVEQAALVVTNIQEKIDLQNQSIAKAQAGIPQTPSRLHERHSLLADVALGNASDSDLKKLDAAIAKEQKAVADAGKEVAPLIEHAQATVSGLMRKLESARETLQMIESKSDEVAYRYFMGEVEKVATQYVNHALHLKELHRRLLGLDLILNKHDGRGIKCPGTNPIKIPMFRLPQFDGLGNPNTGNWALLNGDQIYGEHVTQAADAEEARFNAILAGHFYQ